MVNDCYIAIDTGGTKIAGALVGASGNILHQDTVYLGGKSGKEAAAVLMKLLRSLQSRAREADLRSRGAGVCIPGIVYHESGNVWAPNIPGWENYPLRTELRKELGGDMRIRIDSDRACAILGETWKGAAQGCRDAIFVAVGTGIGAGILVNGKIMRGHRDIAGATGWMALKPPYEHKYEACGCFEYYASGDGIARTAAEVLEKYPDYQGILRKKDLRAEDVFSAFEQSDPVAAECFDRVIELWGMAAANYVSLFNPEKIIFGGGIFGPAARFLPRIAEEAKKWAQPIGITQVSLEASRLGKDAGLFGAARLAMTTETKDSA